MLQNLNTNLGQLIFTVSEIYIISTYIFSFYLQSTGIQDAHNEVEEEDEASPLVDHGMSKQLK